MSINTHQSEDIIFADLELTFEPETTYQEIEKFTCDITKRLETEFGKVKVNILINSYKE